MDESIREYPSPNTWCTSHRLELFSQIVLKNNKAGTKLIQNIFSGVYVFPPEFVLQFHSNMTNLLLNKCHICKHKSVPVINSYNTAND